MRQRLWIVVARAAGGDIALQGHKAHTGSIEVFISAAPFVHAEKAAHHEAVHHIHYRLGHGAVQGFVGVNAFLHNHFGNRQPFFYLGHFIAVFAVEAAHFIGGFHAHHAHAVGAGIGLYNHKRRIANAFFIVFGLNFGQQARYCGRQLFFAFALLKIQAADFFKIRVNRPFVDAHQRSKFGRHAVVGGKMVGFAAGNPAAVQRRQHHLAQALQNWRHAAG